MDSLTCEYTTHLTSYGKVEPLAEAKVLIRITCPYCSYFRIQRWCEHCWNGVQHSGRRWQCNSTRGCGEHISADDKLKYVVRIGDV